MKNKKNIILGSLLVVFLMTSIPAYASEFTLSQTKITANVGETIDLDVVGTKVSPKWTSYNVNTAKVDSDGVVTTLRKGKTTISARIGLTRKTCSINVVDSSIKLNKTAATIYTGGTSTNAIQLKATVKGATKGVTWTSSDESVATVDAKGKVTSVSAGNATITATANGKSASCIVTVKQSNISLNMDMMQLSTKGNGSSIKLTPTIVGSSKGVKWTTSDKKIATVSGGKVTGKNTGTATITATANGVSATCKVNVVKNSISINEEKVLLYADETKQLKTNAGKKDVVVWESSNPTVATIDESGKITAKKAGTVTISATLNGTTDTCEVTVKKTATTIDEGIVFLETKGTYTLNYDVVGRKSSVKWTTSNKSIATVSKGKVTAKKAGTVTITATANGVSDTVEVVVKDSAPTISLNQKDYVLYTKKGNTVALKATVKGSSKTVTWNSSDESVATVKKGKVTALKEGTTLITATANGVTAECLITVKESKVILGTENIWLNKGETAELPVDVVGSSQTVKYSTTNKKVATVTSKGVITAKGFGKADIKVTANGITSICHIIVSECEHSYEGVVTKEATCKETGIKEFTCIHCGNSYSETIPKTEHNFVKSETVKATCLNSGYVTYTCEICEATKQETIEATGHNYGEWQIVTEATEYVEGIEKRVCKNCGNEETRKTAKKEHQHLYEEVVTEPTCMEKGYTTFICECGDTYVGNYTDAAGHDWSEWAVIKKATKTEEGVKRRICKKCNKNEYEIIPIHQHSYEEKVIAPTCTKMGYTIHTCACGDSYVDNYTEVAEHSYDDGVITKEATCKEEGIKTYTCENCNYSYTEKIGYGECVIEDIVTEPTCRFGGYTKHKCSVCGQFTIDSYTEALGHSYDEGVVTKEATCKEEGVMTYSCIRCDNSYTISIPKTKIHSYEDKVVDSTCTEKGYTKHTCSVCGDSYEDAETDALGHDFVGVVKTEATDYSLGMKTYSCTRSGCNHSEDHEYALAHEIDLGNGETTVVYGYWDMEAAEEVFDLLNAYRVENGLNELTRLDVLDEHSKTRALEIVYSFSHVKPNGDAQGLELLGKGINCAENIAMGYTTPDEVMVGWKNSVGHNANMLDDWSIYGSTGTFITLYYYNDDMTVGNNEFSSETQTRHMSSPYWVQNFACYLTD